MHIPASKRFLQQLMLIAIGWHVSDDILEQQIQVNTGLEHLGSPIRPDQSLSSWLIDRHLLVFTSNPTRRLHAVGKSTEAHRKSAPDRKLER